MRWRKRSDDGIETYLREAVSWDDDRVSLALRSASVAWRVAAAGWVCSVATALALVVLMPLKRVEPFVVRVDRTTGIVDVVPGYTGGGNIEESVTRYFLAHYITVCERFNLSTAESDYEECGAFQTPQGNQSWYARWNPSNPGSPLNRHRDGSSVRAEVTAVSFFKRASGLADLAQVRYVTSERPAAGGAERATHWIASVQYAYSAPPSDPKLRRWNPIGFRVLDLKTEPEISTPPSAPDAHAGRS